jgi:oligopeptide transport system ATP-binding protein
VRAVDGVSWQVRAGETLAILGESGSGKSVSTQALTGILEMPPGRILSGSAEYRGDDLISMSVKERRKIVGDRITMVFQDSLSALNPVQSVGKQIAECYRVHRGLSKQEAMKRAAEMLDQVRIPAAAQRVNDYPHEFSGGMRQRVMLAMALALDPDVLIADEPTTALDVTVQAQILELLRRLAQDRGSAMLFITRDIGITAHFCDRVAVIYNGEIMELAGREDFFFRPAHPYTIMLMAAFSYNQSLRRLWARPEPLPGAKVHDSACPYTLRCPLAQERCRIDRPALREIAPGHYASCHFPVRR